MAVIGFITIDLFTFTVNFIVIIKIKDDPKT